MLLIILYFVNSINCIITLLMCLMNDVYKKIANIVLKIILNYIKVNRKTVYSSNIFTDVRVNGEAIVKTRVLYLVPLNHLTSQNFLLIIFTSKQIPK